MDGLAEHVREFIRKYDLLTPGQPVLVGLSGGPDSIILSHVLLEVGHPISCVHVNYRLRSDQSDADEAFVRAWCRDRKVDLIVRSFETEGEAARREESVQEAARRLRYEVFEHAAEEAGLKAVATGHHRDDQAETVLMNLFRGSGPEGLAGMPVKRPIRPDSRVYIVRPLIEVRREAVEAYGRECGLDWRVDATNLAVKYKRGALRGTIVPLIQQHFGEGTVENIARSAELMREYVEEFLEEPLRRAFGAALRSDREGGTVELDVLTQLPDVLRHRVILEAVRRWFPGFEATSNLVREIDALANTQPGRRMEIGNAQVWRERRWLRFRRDGPDSGESGGHDTLYGRRKLDPGCTVEVPGGTLSAELLPFPPDDLEEGAPNSAYLDADTVRFPLTVRRWEAGDRFVPLGMDHEKKLSDFLTDEKVPPHRKASVCVVESDGRIVWVVPLRIHDAVRIRPETEETVRLRLTLDGSR